MTCVNNIKVLTWKCCKYYCKVFLFIFDFQLASYFSEVGNSINPFIASFGRLFLWLGLRASIQGDKRNRAASYNFFIQVFSNYICL